MSRWAPRYSLGMTLWHLGHNTSMIERFHNFVRAQDLSPEKLLPASAQQPPASTTQLLLEPELLAQEQLGGWNRDREFITSGAGDAGPTVSLPLAVPQAGLFRFGCCTTASERSRCDVSPDLPCRP